MPRRTDQGLDVGNAYDHTASAFAGGRAGPERHAATTDTAPAEALVVAPIGLLILVSMVQPIGLNMHVPAMAEMQRDLGTSSTAISLTVSAYLLATALAQLVIGPLSDLKGRRPVLLIGMWVFALGSALCALAPNAEALIAGRVIQAAGGCAGIALARAIVRDVYPRTSAASAIGYVTMGMAVAPMVTPALGGLLVEASSWRVIFLFMLVFAACAALVAQVRLIETHPPSGEDGAFGRFLAEARELLAVRAFWLYVVTLALLCTTFFAFVAGGVFVSVEVFDLSASGYGLFFMTVSVGYLVGNYVTGRYVGRVGIVPMIVIGNAATLAGVTLAMGATLAGSSHPLALFGPMLVVGLGNGFALPSLVAASVSVRPHLAGTASGLAGAFQMGGGAIASGVVGVVIDAQFWPGTLWPVLGPMLFGAAGAFMLSLVLRSSALR
ncbi:multidrug effflux MFS transporter [Acuticoccus sp.]|uniref:multidrug effflux MFS transporter n=1 Tax=Acuticoccus sp. TaxID=1904378 RepID=UPI003B5276E2